MISKFYGPGSFLYMNTAVYGPGTVMSILQSRYDARLAAKYGSRLISGLRLWVSYGLMSLILFVLPSLRDWIPNDDSLSLTMILTLVSVLGGLAMASYGTLSQISYELGGHYIGWLTLGFQCCGVLTFTLSLATN